MVNVYAAVVIFVRIPKQIKVYIATFAYGNESKFVLIG